MLYPALSKTLALLFDEHKLFEGPLENPVATDSVSINKEKSPPKAMEEVPKILSTKPLALARSKTSNEPVSTPRPKIIERFSSEELKPQSFDVDAMLQSSKSHQPVDTNTAPVSSKDMGLRVDTRNDFMSWMREAAANSETEEAGGNGKISTHLISSLGSMSSAGTGRRRFFTLPAMATIQESETEDNKGGVDSSFTSQSRIAPTKRNEPLDSELILQEKAKPKQFRVPQVSKVLDGGSNTDGISSFLDSISHTPATTKTKESDATTDTTANSSELSVNQNTLLVNDDDIETAGTAFLDKISETMGSMGFLE
jgi:hypothetical protein